MAIAALAARLGAMAATFAHEDGMQQAIADLLTAVGIDFRREVDLGSGNRIDFLVGDVGIECKVAGSLASVGEQLLRYRKSGRCEGGLVLVTTRAIHAHLRPMAHVVVLRGGIL